ncbi:MAG: hypothetical protein KF734_04275 [Saprospiraceae bacterium]|nr:hypothetical protein [Saprospiraceae bacterium]
MQINQGNPCLANGQVQILFYLGIMQGCLCGGKFTSHFLNQTHTVNSLFAVNSTFNESKNKKKRFPPTFEQ